MTVAPPLAAVLLHAALLAPPLLPEGEKYDPAVPTPESVIGFEVGDRHLRHDQLVIYLRAVAAASARVSLDTYATTHDGRPCVVLTVTSPENREELDELPATRAKLVDPGADPPAPDSTPAVVWAGYSVHGDEASAGNAAALVAYHLAASQSDETARILDRCVVLLDPCLNPDGFDRFAAWVNGNRGRVANPDPDHREHNQPTPTGRTNGYWFDLNRDWLPAVHPESRGRLELFYRWRPNVVLDFHEMGPDSTYFFQPGVPERNHPLTPARNLELTERFAAYTADVFDAAGEPYFTGERFDDFYMGKGSTYPDLHGAVGILYEQASARGLVQEGDFGEVTFAGTIANQVRASLAALRAAADLRGELNGYLRDFYERSGDLSADAPAGYLIEPSADPVRNAAFAASLIRHGIRVETTAAAAGEYRAAAMFVGLDQPEARFARALFDERTDFRENIFYDVSAWTLPDAFGLRWRSAADAPADRSEYQEATIDPVPLDLGGAVAVLLDGRHGRAVRAVYDLLAADVRVRAAGEPFSAAIAGRRREFGRGTYLVHLGRQRAKREVVRRILTKAAADGLPVFAAGGGLTPAGVDLGSGSFLRLTKPRVLLAAGDGVSQYGSGSIWHALDFRRRIPCTLVAPADFGRATWTDDTVLILPDGDYSGVSEAARDRLRAWVRGGGTVIAVGTAARFLKRTDILDVTFGGDAPTKPEGDDGSPPRRAYGRADDERALELVSGAIFTAEPDVTHPLLWGLEDRPLSVFVNNTLWPARSPSPYGTPLMLTDPSPGPDADGAAPAPVKAGYASPRNRGLAAGSAYLRADRVGRGRVVTFAADPCFRGFWHGTESLLANALLLAPLVDAPDGPPDHAAPRLPPAGCRGGAEVIGAPGGDAGRRENDAGGGDLSIRFGTIPLILMPERAVFRADTRTLFVADTHWGKTATLRAGGIPVPAGVTGSDFARLSAALRRSAAVRLVVLGDLLHARRGRGEAATAEAIRRWRDAHPDLAVTLVRGNHDRAAGDPDAAWRIDVVPDPWPDPPLVLKHFPDPDPAGPVLAGHEHPAVRLNGPGGERLKLSCFRLADRVLTLPAFSTFVDGGTIRPTAEERICVIADGEVIELPRTSGKHR